MKTMLGVPSPLAGLSPLPPAQPAQPQPRAQMVRTMLGVAMPGIAPIEPESPPRAVFRGGGTILGVAVPGIAPLQPQGPANVPGGRTMLGVAVPGIAPNPNAQYAAPPAPIELPPIVPAPAPLIEPAPLAPLRAPAKRGVPIVLVALIVALMLVVGGGAIALLVRGGTPLVASARVGPQGEDQLHLECEKCPDETRVSSGPASATFKGQQADLPLPAQLVVGSNPIELVLARPGARTETVKLVVPVSFRVETDLSEITATPPRLLVRVEAKPGSQVKIDGTSIPLADGAATLTVPLGDEAVGPRDDLGTVDKTVTYEVTSDGKTERGTVKARVPIAPLHVDAPGSLVLTDAATLLVAGRAVKGASVTVAGRPATSRPDGTFEAQVDVPGDMTIAVNAWMPKAPASAPLGTRTVVLKVHKVGSLADEAREQDAANSLGYDAVANAIEANVGQPFVVHGPVLDARTANHQTVLVVNDVRGCATRRCPVRVVYGGDTPVARGEIVRAYGLIAGTVATSDGRTVPQLDATFLVKGGAGR